MMERKANEMLGVTFNGNVTFNGPMFDIHDNQHVYIKGEREDVKEKKDDVRGKKDDVKGERTEELFHFVHPELDETEAWRIHDAVKRAVKLQGIQMICQYLTQLKSEKKVLLPPIPSTAYAELVRLGMPDGEGFNESTFRKYYNK